MELKKLINKYLDICKYQNNLNKKTIKAYRLDLRQFNDFISHNYVFYEKTR